MNIQKAWEKALRDTEVIRTRIQSLSTFSETEVPYILLSESSINGEDTVVRKGRILVEKPALILPPYSPQFQGFDFDDQQMESEVTQFLLLRGVCLPSLQYDNKTNSLDIHESKLSDAIKQYNEKLQSKEDVVTGLMIGPQECWQFSLLIFICTQVIKNVNLDMKNLIKQYKEKNET